MFRFTIRDVLWLTVVVGILVAWWADDRRCDAVFQQVEDERIEYEIDNEALRASHAHLVEMFEEATGQKVSFPPPAPVKIVR